MTLIGELMVTVIGGIITAIVLEFMGRSGSRSRSDVPAASAGAGSESTIGGLIRVLLAVAGGIAIAMIGGRMLIQAGIMPKGLPGRLVLLVVGTVLVWLLLSISRRR